MEKEKLNRLIDISITTSNACFEKLEKNFVSSDYKKVSNELLLLKSRLNKPELFILIAGEAKVGKSTFVNRIVGEDICPSSDEICTNVPSLIRYGEENKIIVHFKSDDKGVSKPELVISREQIPEYTTEVKNTRNKESVDYLEIQINSAILSNGLVYIDTPGLGALEPRHAVATLEMATRADIILFLGNTDKELSSFEIASLKILIDCSKCAYVTHVLTCCDRGDAEAIKNCNGNTLKENFPDRNIQTICVSSFLYSKYLDNRKDIYLQKSGFANIFSYIDYVASIQENILVEICSNELLIKNKIILSKISSIKEIVEDPFKLESRLSNLEICEKRISELIEKKDDWKSMFAKEHSNFCTKIEKYINERESKLFDDIDELVKNDIYLNDKKQMTSQIQGKLTVFKSNLGDQIQNGMLAIYEYVKTETKFSKFQALVRTPGLDKIDVKLPKNCGEISSFITIRNHLSSAVLGYGAVHLLGSVGAAIGLPSISAEIGAMVGSIAPGIGNLIGAAGGWIVGAIAGLLMSISYSKDTKRNKMAAECKKSSHKFFEEVKEKVKDSMKENGNLLSNQFSKELSEEKKICIEQIRNLQPLAISARIHWDFVTNAYENLAKIDQNLSK